MLITVVGVITLISLNGYGIIGEIAHSQTPLITRDDTKIYNTHFQPKTFEDLFLPRWLENGTYNFKVPAYMHHFNFAFATTWAKFYQYGYEKGRPAEINVSDEKGHVYLRANNSNTAGGVPIGGPGRYNGNIIGNRITIYIKGKILLQFGVWGSWTENILKGGIYNVTLNGSKIALYMDYYNPTSMNTFYFKASKRVYGYLIAADGSLQDYTDKSVKEGALTEHWDTSPFLTFIRPNGEEGNISVQFWAGYEGKKSDPMGAVVVMVILVAVIVGAYFYSKRAVYGKRGNRN